MAQLLLSDFPTWTNERIRETLLNRVETNILYYFTATRDYLQSIIDLTESVEVPNWFIDNFETAIRNFVDLLKLEDIDKRLFQKYIDNYRNTYIYNYGNDMFKAIAYPLPFLENYARNLKNELASQQTDQTQLTINQTLNQFDSDSKEKILTFDEKFKVIESKAEATLTLLNKDAGKIGVKAYAEIFDNQAIEHSSFYASYFETDRVTKQELKKFRFFGKAQWWLIAAIITFGALVISFSHLDSMFSLDGLYIFTPKTLVHIVGRFLFISLIIFIVSFSFKQYRVNMHLYTLNKHRANTLKSFEYLSRAPDPLAPDTYNAILKEVSKAIYESGHTGYISSSDGNSDMPSIVDMSKIITQAKD